MIPLATNQRILVWFCVHPNDVTFSRCQKIAYSMRLFGIFYANFTVVLISSAFILQFISEDVIKSLSSSFQLTGSGSAAYACILIYFSRHKITGFLEHLSGIYKEFEKSNSYRHLVEVNNRSEWIWQLYFKYVMFGFFICTNTLIVGSLLLCYIVYGTFDINFVFKPYEVSEPWNQDTLLAYIINSAIYNTVWQAYFVANGAIFLLFISICWHHHAFYRIFKDLLQKLDGRDGNQQNALCNVIRFHNVAKGWFEETADVFSRYFFIQLIFNMLTLAISVFLLDMQIKHTDSHLQIILYEGMMGVLFLFLYCYYGRMSTESYAKMFRHLYAYNWYTMPVELQKFFILMIGNAQRPCYYHGFEMIILNLETFCTVIKTVYTWYMMFKAVISK